MKDIGGRTVLDDINLSIAPGDSIALLGANGAGKTTLLRVIAALIPPTRGELHLFGTRAADRRRPARARIGLIGHQLMLYRDLTALENLHLFGRLHHVPEPRRRARELLDLLGLSDRADEPVRTLSRGMAQRVAIARSLVHDPELLLADEPFSGLDQDSSDRLGHALSSLHAAGRTIILTHHDSRRALALCHRAVILRDGRITLDAASSALTERETATAIGSGP